jgi:hypothetical protein
MNRDLVKAIFLQASNTTLNPVYPSNHKYDNCVNDANDANDANDENNVNDANTIDNEYIIRDCEYIKITLRECSGKKNVIKTIVNINSVHMIPKNCEHLHIYASEESKYISLTKNMIPDSVKYLKLTLMSNYIQKGAIPKNVKKLTLYYGTGEINELLDFNIPNTVKHLRISGKIQLVPGDIPFGVIHVEFMDELNYEFVPHLFPDSVTHIILRSNGKPLLMDSNQIFPRNLKMLDFKDWYVYEEFCNGFIPETCAYIHFPHYFTGTIPKYAKYVFFETCTNSIEEMNLPNNIAILDIGIQSNAKRIQLQDMPVCLSIIAIPKRYIDYYNEYWDTISMDPETNDYDDGCSGIGSMDDMETNMDEIMNIGNLAITEQAGQTNIPKGNGATQYQDEDGNMYYYEDSSSYQYGGAHKSTGTASSSNIHYVYEDEDGNGYGSYCREYDTVNEDEINKNMCMFISDLDNDKYLVLEYDNKHKSGYCFRNALGVYEYITFDEMKNTINVIEKVYGYGDGRNLKGRIIYFELCEKIRQMFGGPRTI